MSPSVLTSFPSDQTLFEHYAHEDDGEACPGAFKRVKLYHDSSPSDADSTRTLAGASSCSSGDDLETLSGQNLSNDEDHSIHSDNDVHLMIADQAPHEESDISSNGMPDPEDDEYRYLPGSTRLRRLLERSDHLIVCPGVFDGFSARVAMSVGFEGLYMVRNISIHETFPYLLTVHVDWCRHNGITTGHAGPRSCPAPRHARASRNDMQPRPRRSPRHRRHGWYATTRTILSVLHFAYP